MAAGGRQAGAAPLARAGPDGLQRGAVGCGEAYSASVRAHSETVLRSFYDFHREAGTGPVLNPFPLDRSRRGGRAHAHHNPMEPHHPSAAGFTGRRCRPGSRAVPDDEFNEIFAGCGRTGTGRWWRSTCRPGRGRRSCCRRPGRRRPGAAADPRRPQGQPELQELPASSDAFVWLRLYQMEMDGLVPAGSGQPLWWTLRRPFRPLAYHAAHRMFERAGRPRALRDPSLAAPHRRLPDGRGPGLPLTDVQAVLGHAQLTTTQIYLTPRKEDVIRRVLAHHAEQVRRPERVSRPAPGYRAESPGRAVRPRNVVAAGAAPPPRRRRCGCGLRRRGPSHPDRLAEAGHPPAPRPWRSAVGWRARDRRAHEACAGLAGGPGGAPGSSGGWPAGPTLPEREVAGGTHWLRLRRTPSLAWRPVRRLVRHRRRRPAPVSDVAGCRRTRRGAGPRHGRAPRPRGFHPAAGRATLTLRFQPPQPGAPPGRDHLAAKGGTLADITVGDVVELLDAEATPRRHGKRGRRLLSAPAPDGGLRPGTAGRCASCAPPASARPRS